MNELIDRIEELAGPVLVPLRDNLPVDEAHIRELEQLLDEAARQMAGADVIPKRLAELITLLQVDALGALDRYPDQYRNEPSRIVTRILEATSKCFELDS